MASRDRHILGFEWYNSVTTTLAEPQALYFYCSTGYSAAVGVFRDERDQESYTCPEISIVSDSRQLQG